MKTPSLPTRTIRSIRSLLWNGLVITIEPLIAEHPARAVEDRDGWTMKTSNGSLSAHFEHTVVITDGRPILLTAA